MPQQQTLSPLALAERYAFLTASQTGLETKTGALGLIALLGVVFVTRQVLLRLPVNVLLLFVLLLLILVTLPLLLNRGSRETAIQEAYLRLLTLIKDDTLRVSLTERVIILATLPKSTPPPLPALAQARLAQKLAYATPHEIAELPRAPLHAWLQNSETSEDLKVALLLTLGATADYAILPLAQSLSENAPTERLREAALECLKSMEPPR